MGHLSIGGEWLSPLRHINLLEMEAVRRVLVHFASQLKGHHVLIRSDNTTVVAYLTDRGEPGPPPSTGWRRRFYYRRTLTCPL